MDKDTRNAIERATQRARKLIEEEFAAQLEGDFDVHRDGAVAAKAGSHLSARQAFQRERIVAAIEHKRAAGMSAGDAVRDYLRDAAFTTINRFVALKMLEARDLVQECITKGEQSAGYREFCGMAPGLPLLPDSAGYRLYIESLFDELSTEVKVLFDRRDPSSVLWPKRATFESVLEILNATELARLWGEDETIGWVYQFFNGQDERKKMREESQAPRNSRELAVRNQFFTPRYVVQFLTDNTLGRIWYEMLGSKTVLAERCEYMVRKPGEEFEPRARKDPRDLRVLDPACGSGHFLLYAFDLLVAIYEEAHADPGSPKSDVTGRTLAEDYPSLDALRKAVPGLVLAHNLNGVDIDPRCAQIAQLALWMRAQTAYRDYRIHRAERAQIRRSNIVVAEPLVADKQIANDFVAKLGDAELGRVFGKLVESLSLAGDLGLLLRVEQLVNTLAKTQGDLFAPPGERIRAAINAFMREDAGATSTRRRLFADDAAHGLALLGVAEQRFDVVLMNPPFGDPTPASKEYIFEHFDRERIDLGGCFISRCSELLSGNGRLGVIANRTLLFAASLGEWREEKLRGATAVADLGHGVLDALVETAALTLGTGASAEAAFIGALDVGDKEHQTRRTIRAIQNGDTASFRPVAEFAALFGAPFAYWVPPSIMDVVARMRPAEKVGVVARQGLATCDNFRFLRLAWEVPGKSGDWSPLTKGGEYQPFWAEVALRARWSRDGREIKAYIDALHGQWSRVVQSTDLYRLPGATYSERTASSLSLRVLPRDCLFDKVGPFVGSADAAFSERAAVALIGLSYTTPYRFLVETAVGLRDGTTSGSAARHYLPSMVQRLPWPEFSESEWAAVQRESNKAIAATRDLLSTDELSQFWYEPETWRGATTLESLAMMQLLKWCELQAVIYSAADKLEELGKRAVGVKSDDDYSVLESIAGPSPLRYARRPLTPHEEVRDLLELRPEELILRVSSSGNAHSTIFKKGYWGDRAIELVAHLLRAHPLSVLDAVKDAGPSAEQVSRTAWAVLSTSVAIAFERVRAEALFRAAVDAVPPDLFFAPSATAAKSCPTARPILVDDPGHQDDLVGRVERAVTGRFGNAGIDALLTSLAQARRVGSLREFIADAFFVRHLSQYSLYRRQAPIYWQLSIPSGRYSVWLYSHAFGKDTLFRAQNDYVVPKLGHEHRRLESLANELRDGATAAQRKELAAQEALVDELRAFLDDVKRVAPLWKPNLDDGVIINYALLWRLVSQNKPWQKELKSTWDALCEGKYDWAHLAMHLWPERVVPKCAKDRSLAIAHGLEDVFWVEGTDGKWTACKTPTCSVDELVRERTSPAVKSALKSLLEAPAAAGKSGGRSGGGRRKATAAADGEIA